MSNVFPTDTTGLADAVASEPVDLADDAEFRLQIGPVRKRLGDHTVRMLGYNGSIPGPTLRVPEGSEIRVDVHNEGDLDATVHWHGLRLENSSDGTHETQQPIPVGGDFSCRVQFPDPGLYWYHPHIREDYGQEMGLYGNVVVVPRGADYWPPAHRELVLTLDDVLIEDGKIAVFSQTETNYAAMGRFGNLLLIAGEPHLDLAARRGEVIRLYFTNTANTRVFNVGVSGVRMKLVGGDSGRVEHEQFVDSVILAPSERVIVDVMLDQPGDFVLEHRTPERTYPLADIRVAEDRAEPSLEDAFASLRTNAEFAEERARLDAEIKSEPDKILAFVAEMDLETPSLAAGEQLDLRLPDASRGRQRRAGQVPEVRHETSRRRRADRLRLPDAPGSDKRPTRPLPEMRDEAGTGPPSRKRSRRPPSACGSRAPRPFSASRPCRRSRARSWRARP